MPREKEDYRLILADMLEHFGNKRLLTIKEAAEYLGVTPQTAAKRYGITKKGIMVQSLARLLCQ